MSACCWRRCRSGCGTARTADGREQTVESREQKAVEAVKSRTARGVNVHTTSRSAFSFLLSVSAFCRLEAIPHRQLQLIVRRDVVEIEPLLRRVELEGGLAVGKGAGVPERVPDVADKRDVG